jgi:hypothetical protein
MLSYNEGMRWSGMEFVLIGNLLQTFRRTLKPPFLGQSRNYPNSEDEGSTILRNVSKTPISTAYIPGSSNLHQERHEKLRSHDYQYMDCVNCGKLLAKYIVLRQALHLGVRSIELDT